MTSAASSALKTIVVALDERFGCRDRLEPVLDMAARHQAHLVGVCQQVQTPAQLLIDAPLPPEYLERFEKEQDKRLSAIRDEFESMRGQAGIDGELKTYSDGTVQSIVSLSYTADLIVIGQDPDPLSDAAAELAGDFLLDSACPLLLLPSGTQPPNMGERVLVAWNGSREAARAIASAMPMLQAAKWVEVAAVVPARDPSLKAKLRLDALDAHLKRHGVEPTMTLLEQTHAAPDTRLTELAFGSKADLIVMGAFGHARLREWLFGGVTYDLLRYCTLPMWLSH